VPSKISTTDRAAERNAAIAEMRRDHTYQAISDKFGITRQRVQQILKAMGRDQDYVPALRHCDWCNEDIPFGERHHKHTVRRPDGRFTPEVEMKYEDICTDYLAGMRMREISQKYRTATGKPITYTYIFHVLRKMNIEPNRGGGSYIRDEEALRLLSESQRGKKKGQPKKIRGWRADE
jgi:hypothetical protein